MTSGSCSVVMYSTSGGSCQEIKPREGLEGTHSGGESVINSSPEVTLRFTRGWHLKAHSSFV